MARFNVCFFIFICFIIRKSIIIILFFFFSADEHLRFYGTLKGLTGDLLDEHVDYWLEQVKMKYNFKIVLFKKQNTCFILLFGSSRLIWLVLETNDQNNILVA